MAFDAHVVSLKIIEVMREPVVRIRRRDRDLGDQLRRALQSVAANVGEGRRRVGADRLYLWRIAAGSAAEAETQIRIAVAWGYLPETEIAAALELLDREQAMLWKLTH